WVQGPPGDSLQPEAIGAVMEVTKWLKPSNSGHDLVTARVCRPQRFTTRVRPTDRPSPALGRAPPHQRKAGWQALRAREKGAAPHSMTSSARARIDGGIVSPSDRAVLRLTTSSNLVGRSTGRSAGFAPLRILST